ncbi:hypothetical protein B0H17DRAFT_1140937 [Mycena rosella]|uniref:Uncharacterized protein n=1 Tax=Mycena rosella TaxID=1033263 RepID=A0AAD7D0T9_MYCRO|nr:hypothetical protein B0H17DRAFT_1140937 [Mycena rosella]
MSQSTVSPSTPSNQNYDLMIFGMFLLLMTSPRLPAALKGWNYESTKFGIQGQLKVAPQGQNYDLANFAVPKAETMDDATMFLFHTIIDLPSNGSRRNYDPMLPGKRNYSYYTLNDFHSKLFPSLLIQVQLKQYLNSYCVQARKLNPSYVFPCPGPLQYAVVLFQVHRRL